MWYFFSEGLQVYSLPENYVEPYQWIGLQDGDFKVVSVNRDSARWSGYSYGFEFAFGGMLTEIGWAHDIGYESSFIHNKPVLQNGGWDENARGFVDYLRYRMIGQQKTRDFLKFLGPFNYKYVVLPAYLDQDVRDFFLNQEGFSNNIIYNENGAMIIENSYYTPRFFGTCEYASVLGGFKTFPSLLNLESFNLNQTALFFLDGHVVNQFNDLQKHGDALMFVNTDFIDLVMLQLRDNGIIINAEDFGVYSTDTSKYWTQVTSWRDVGAYAIGGATLTTYGNNSVDIPFEISQDGVYDVWVRIGFLSGRGKLSVFADSNFVGEITPEADYWCGLLWVKLNALYFDRGTHVIRLSNEGNGFNDVDAIAVVESDIFRSACDELLSSIEAFQGRIVDINGAANLFAYKLPEGWAIRIQEYEDDLLKAENTTFPVAASHFILRQDRYMVALRLASGPDYGILNLKMGNYSFQFDCYCAEEKFQWY